MKASELKFTGVKHGLRVHLCYCAFDGACKVRREGDKVLIPKPLILLFRPGQEEGRM